MFQEKNKKLIHYLITTCIGAMTVAFIGVHTPVEAVSVGPVKIEYKIDPNTTVQGEFYIKNDESEVRTFYLVVEKFTEQDGKKIFVKDENSLINEWLQSERSLTLAPGQERRIPYTLSVPVNAPPGGHTAVIWWSAASPDKVEGEQLSINTRAGILMYVNISGDIRGDANVSALYLSDKKKIFWNSSDVYELTATINNQSNMYIKPQGEIVIKNIFGGEKSIAPFNAKGYQILSGSQRTIERMEVPAPGIFFGAYKAEASVIYSGLGTESAESIWFFVFPLKLSLGLLLLLLMIFVGGPIFLKKYNNYIVKKSRQS